MSNETNTQAVDERNELREGLLEYLVTFGEVVDSYRENNYVYQKNLLADSYTCLLEASGIERDDDLGIETAYSLVMLLHKLTNKLRPRTHYHGIGFANNEAPMSVAIARRITKFFRSSLNMDVTFHVTNDKRWSINRANNYMTLPYLREATIERNN